MVRVCLHSLTLDHSNETRQQMEARMASLENTITGLMGTTKSSDTPPTHILKPSTSEGVNPRAGSELNGPASGTRQKRANSGPLTESGICSLSIWNTYNTENSQATSQFSAVEAQTMIQKVLRQGDVLSKQKREAFHSALASLSESLHTSFLDASSMSANPHDLPHTQEWLDAPAIPSVEAMQVSVMKQYSLPFSIDTSTYDIICCASFFHDLINRA